MVVPVVNKRARSVIFSKCESAPLQFAHVNSGACQCTVW